MAAIAAYEGTLHVEIRSYYTTLIGELGIVGPQLELSGSGEGLCCIVSNNAPYAGGS